ncbi:hypothetical protein SOVF_138090 isoform B [Spinacia oleracea]|uniref:Double-stranded RNA-binding protein 1 n=1 Tax=Spinacia oleracea TaxID=3562 RepID=A0A9R0IC90_SPIOL|nr:double-stranded RNA-binding protein 1 [Spinacia oleracea]KNA11127.1 hypothetical protein SOVF_138090 isoform B [Spinacia oleracea]
MYKSKLQEFCQSKKWQLPEYSTQREGLDHCPQFKATVSVNGSTFTTPNPSKSSKEAHNLVAHIAFQHLTGSSSASTALQVQPTFIDAQQPKTNESLQATSFSVVNSPNRDDKKLKDMTHLHKNQLQIYAQKRNLNLPVYISERDGPPHACRFKCKVLLEGKTYESHEFFSTLKDAENAAAKTALMSVSSDRIEEEDPGFFKNLLQELAQKEYACLPAYVTTRSGPPHNPIFSSAVEINEESFTGQEAKTKKLAEMNAAKVAYIVLKERKGKQNSKADSPGFHVNDASHYSSPQSHLIPVAESPDKHISAPDPVSKRLYMEQVRCGNGSYGQDTDQNVRGLGTGPSTQNLSSDPSQSPSRSLVHEISQKLGGSDVSSSSHKRIKVFPLTPNMTLPTGATVMHKDDKWIAVSMD